MIHNCNHHLIHTHIYIYIELHSLLIVFWQNSEQDTFPFLTRATTILHYSGVINFLLAYRAKLVISDSNK